MGVAGLSLLAVLGSCTRDASREAEPGHAVELIDDPQMVREEIADCQRLADQGGPEALPWLEGDWERNIGEMSAEDSREHVRETLAMGSPSVRVAARSAAPRHEGDDHWPHGEWTEHLAIELPPPGPARTRLFAMQAAIADASGEWWSVGDHGQRFNCAWYEDVMDRPRLATRRAD